MSILPAPSFGYGGHADGLMDSTKSPLRIWFLAMYLIGQVKTGLSALSLTCHLRTSYRTASLVHQKVMLAMVQLDSKMGTLQLDYAYLGSEEGGLKELREFNDSRSSSRRTRSTSWVITVWHSATV